MYFQKRSGKYSFIYYDHKLKKNVRLPQEEVPKGIDCDEKAAEFCRRKMSENDAAKVRIQRQQEWRSQFFDFKALLELYEADRKRNCPNSWQGDVFYLSHYALPFFLQTKSCNNLSNWPLFYEEFRELLLVVEPFKRKTATKTLAYASKNLIIKSLNTFMSLMVRKNKVGSVPKCKYFEREFLYSKGVESVIPDREAKIIYDKLKETDELSADAFHVCLNTGMRENELFGLPLSSIFSGEPTDDTLKKSLKMYGMACIGYIVLDSQPKLAKIRDLDGMVPRKPLKSKKKIEPKSNRVIPITDKLTFNILVKRWKEQQVLYAKKVYGKNQRDYLLFDGLTKNHYYSALIRAIKKSKLPHHSPHDTRHTFATNFAKATFGNTSLCRIVLGQVKQEVTDRYIHLYDEIQRNLRVDEQLDAGLEYVD